MRSSPASRTPSFSRSATSRFAWLSDLRVSIATVAPDGYAPRPSSPAYAAIAMSVETRRAGTSGASWSAHRTAALLSHLPFPFTAHRPLSLPGATVSTDEALGGGESVTGGPGGPPVRLSGGIAGFPGPAAGLALDVTGQVVTADAGLGPARAGGRDVHCRQFSRRDQPVDVHLRAVEDPGCLGDGVEGDALVPSSGAGFRALHGHMESQGASRRNRLGRICLPCYRAHAPAPIRGPHGVT